MEKEILKAEKQGGARRITWHCRRAAFAALTPPPTDTLGSAVACGSAWSLVAICPPRPPFGWLKK